MVEDRFHFGDVSPYATLAATMFLRFMLGFFSNWIEISLVVSISPRQALQGSTLVYRQQILFCGSLSHLRYTGKQVFKRGHSARRSFTRLWSMDL